MSKILDVKNLRVSFRTANGTVKAVRDISFDLNKGETLAIVGESGSGKSVTSRAIMGILAGNAIVESGEIIFDGKDLMKINEEDFHSLRGEKLSMVFQDPLSSLNPIIKIGKQLTEAMVIKGRNRQKKAKKKFLGRLKRLNEFMDLAMGAKENPEIAAQNKLRIENFKKFETKHCELEGAYNVACGAAEEVIDETANLILEIERSIAKNIVAECQKIDKLAKKALNPYVVSAEAEKLQRLLSILIITANEIKAKPKFDGLLDALNEVKAIMERALELPMPNFFAMGYYLTFANEPLPQKDVVELNEFLLDYLNKHYLDDFREHAKKGIILSCQTALQYKHEVIAHIDKCQEVFKRDVLDKKEVTDALNVFQTLVFRSFDRLALTRDSVAYSFRASMRAEVKKYFNGLKYNNKEQRKHENSQKKWDALKASGKPITWAVTPAAVVDLEVCKENCLRLMDKLKAAYEDEIAKFDSIDWNAEMEQTIEFFKGKAQDMVRKVTNEAAKIKAIKIMEEVGIKDARRRYNQYPFEFSGGMRQRIVIAIALLAEPQILICDEPTTALDVTIQAQILELINDLKRKFNLSVIFITHDLGVVANMADRVAVMYAGKIVEIGTAEEVFYEPKHPYTWALLSSMPDLNTTEKLDAIPGTPPNMIYPPKGDAFAARNKYAMQIDFEEQPPYFEVSPTHKAATWLLHPDAPKVKVPKIVQERIERNKKMREDAAKAEQQDEKEQQQSQESFYEQASKIFGNPIVENERIEVVEIEEGDEAQAQEDDAAEQKKPAKKPAKKAKVAPKAEEAKADEPKAEEAKAEEAKAEEASADEPKAEEAEAEEVKADEPKVEEVKADEPKVEEAKADEAKADEAKADEPKAEEAEAEEVKAEEAKAEEAKVDEPKEKKPAAKKPAAKSTAAKSTASKPKASGASALKSAASKASAPKKSAKNSGEDS